jgi:hypothetical protein
MTTTNLIAVYCGVMKDGCYLSDGSIAEWNCNNVAYVDWYLHACSPTRRGATRM